jgi:hypothetical protein
MIGAAMHAALLHFGAHGVIASLPRIAQGFARRSETWDVKESNQSTQYPDLQPALSLPGGQDGRIRVVDRRSLRVAPGRASGCVGHAKRMDCKRSKAKTSQPWTQRFILSSAQRLLFERHLNGRR